MSRSRFVAWAGSLLWNLWNRQEYKRMGKKTKPNHDLNTCATMKKCKGNEQQLSHLILPIEKEPKERDSLSAYYQPPFAQTSEQPTSQSTNQQAPKPHGALALGSALGMGGSPCATFTGRMGRSQKPVEESAGAIITCSWS